MIMCVCVRFLSGNLTQLPLPPPQKKNIELNLNGTYSSIFRSNKLPEKRKKTF